MTSKRKMVKANPNSSHDFTEAGFEAAIKHVILNVFPTFSPTDVQHQKSFKITLGHKSYDIKGDLKAWAKGRSDILLKKDGKPLAVLELKKKGLKLTDDDRTQGLSYARLLDPWPPIFIISNNDETQIFETFSGELWNPVYCDEKALAELMKRSANLAEKDLRNAVDTLLGPNSDIWVKVIKNLTRTTLNDLTGDWDDLMSPFPREFLLKRNLTAKIIHLIESGSHIPLVSGPPLSGKSNVLRELVILSSNHNNFVVLFVDTDSTHQGVFQALADALSNELGWSFNVDQVRTWLRRLSSSKKAPKLVLALDVGDADAIKKELDNLISGAYGPNLKIVVAADSGLVENLVLSKSKHHKSKFGKRAIKLELGPLDDEEFQNVKISLSNYRIGFSNGGHRASEFRVPWMLRSIVANISKEKNYSDESLVAMIPSIPGLQHLDFAKDRFASNINLLGRYAKVAEALLADIASQRGSINFALQSIYTYICRRDTLHKHLDGTEINDLQLQGYLKESLLPDNERILVPQLPELLATSLATRLSREILNDLNSDANAAADRLVSQCSSLPFGEVIGAQAIVEAALTHGGLPLQIVTRLLETRPHEKPVTPGTKAKMLFKGVLMDIEFLENGRLLITGPDGQRQECDSDPEEPINRMHADITAWLILSHLATIPLAVLYEGKVKPEGCLDPAILLKVGSCSHVLRKPVVAMEDIGLWTHEIPEQGSIVCHEEGIVEPITLALMQAISGDQERGDYIVQEAIKSGSLALLARVSIALREIQNLADKKIRTWAKRVFETKIKPALENTNFDH